MSHEQNAKIIHMSFVFKEISILFLLLLLILLITIITLIILIIATAANIIIIKIKQEEKVKLAI